MSLTTIRKDCDNGRTCPHVSVTDRGTLVVQGYVISDSAHGIRVPADQIAVELPLALLPELASGPGPAFYVTDRSTVVVHGPALNDPQILAELAIPPTEAAIEIPAATFPFLEVAAGA